MSSSPRSPSPTQGVGPSKDVKSTPASKDDKSSKVSESPSQDKGSSQSESPRSGAVVFALGATEVRDLRRVFDHLAWYGPRTELKAKVDAKEERVKALTVFIDNPTGGTVPLVSTRGWKGGRTDAREDSVAVSKMMQSCGSYPHPSSPLPPPPLPSHRVTPEPR